MLGDNLNYLFVVYINVFNSLDFGICYFFFILKNFVFLLIFVVICIVIFCGNLFVCVIVYIYCVFCFIINYFIVFLVLVDLLVFFLLMLFRIYFILCNNNWCFCFNVCGFWIWVDFVVCSLFIGSLVVVFIDRFVVVKFFFCYCVFFIK